MKFDSMQFLFREELSKIIIDFGIVGPPQALPTKSNRNAYRRILLNLDFNNCSSTKNYLESILFWRRVCRQGMSL